MCTPRTAQELSEVTPRYYAVKDRSHPQDLIPEDESTVPGLELHGYLAGKPVYRSTTGYVVPLNRWPLLLLFFHASCFWRQSC